MKKISIIKQLLFISLVLIGGLLATTNSVNAQFPSIFPGESDIVKSEDQDFRHYVREFYVFVIGAAILVATVFIMIGGMIWITSAGNTGRVEKAKEWIYNAIIGVILLMGAYLILRLINPNLVDLKPIEFPEDLRNLGACVSKQLPNGCQDYFSKTECDTHTGKHHPGETCSIAFSSREEDQANIEALYVEQNNINDTINNCKKQHEIPSTELDKDTACETICKNIHEKCKKESVSDSTCTCSTTNLEKDQVDTRINIICKNEKLVCDGESHEITKGDLSGAEGACRDYCYTRFDYRDPTSSACGLYQFQAIRINNYVFYDGVRCWCKYEGEGSKTVEINGTSYKFRCDSWGNGHIQTW